MIYENFVLMLCALFHQAHKDAAGKDPVKAQAAREFLADFCPESFE